MPERVRRFLEGVRTIAEGAVSTAQDPGQDVLASLAIDLLVELKIARELTGKRRNRQFAYDRYLEIPNKGTEPA